MMSNPDDPTLLQTECSRQESCQGSDLPAPPTLPGYELLMEAGEGTYGAVWQATQMTTGQMVAVKLLKAQDRHALETFQHELERLRKVSSHPYVVGLLDANLENDPPFLVMPWLPQCLSGRAANEKTALDWLVQIAEALQHTHEKGILHCDLKPSNILLDEGGRVRLADFGQSLVLGQDRGTWGTLGWMPPDQVLLGPDGAPSARWDIYAWGAIGYFLLSGARPRLNQEALLWLRSQESTQERLSQYVNRLKSSPLIPLRALNPSVDKDLATVIEACLALEPDHRPATVAEILEDLERRKTGEPLLCKRPWRWIYKAWRWVRRPTVGLTLIFLGLGLSGATLSYVNLHRANLKLRSEQVRLLFERGTMQQRDDLAAALFSWLQALKLSPDDRVIRTNIQQPPVSLLTVGALGKGIPTTALGFAGNDSVWGLLSSYDKPVDRLVIWDLSTGQKLSHNLPGRCLGSSADGRKILVAGSAGVEIIGLPAVQRLAGPFPGVFGRLSSNGDFLAIGIQQGRRSRLEVRRISDGEVLLSHEAGPGHFAMSEDGQTLVFQLGHKTAWVRQGQEVRYLPLLDSRPRRIYDGFLATTDDGGQIQIWELQSGQPVASHQGLHEAQFGPSGVLAQVAGGLGWVSKDDWKTLRKIPSQAIFYSASANGRYLAGSALYDLEVWDQNGLRLQPPLSLPESARGAAGLSLSADGRRLLEWNLEEFRVYDLVAENRTFRAASVESLAFLEGARLLVKISGVDSPQEWDVTSSVRLNLSPEAGRWLDRPWMWRAGLTCSEALLRSPIAVTASEVAVADPSTVVLSDRDGQILKTFPFAGAEFVALSDEDQRIAVASSQNLVVFDTRDGKELRRLTHQGLHNLRWLNHSLLIGHGHSLRDAWVEVLDSHSWTPRRLEQQLLTGSSTRANLILTTGSQTATCYSGETLEPLWRTPEFRVLALFTPDGQSLVTTSARQVFLSDARTGRQLQPPAELPDDISAIALDAGGSQLAIGCQSGFVKTLKFPQPRLGEPGQLEREWEKWTGLEPTASGELKLITPQRWAISTSVAPVATPGF